MSGEYPRPSGPGSEIRLDDAPELLVASRHIGDAPVVLHIPHSSTALPDILLSGCRPALDLSGEAALMADVATHLVADKIAKMVADTFGGYPAWMRSEISRCLVDVERFDSDEEVMNSVGMGVVYSHAHDRSPLYLDGFAPAGEVLELRRRAYRLYADEMTALCERVRGEHGRLVVLDIHSYATRALPYELNQTGRRPRLCVGVSGAELEESIRESLIGFGGTAGVNSPFSGSYCPLSLMDDANTVSVMFEVRKDAYAHDSGCLDGDVARAMERVLATLG